MANAEPPLQEPLRERVLQEFSEDRLGRAATARLVHDRIVAAAPGTSVRIAILGDWGSGKTTVAKWAVGLLPPEQWLVVHFAPWNATTSDELWENFAIALKAAAEANAGYEQGKVRQVRSASRKLYDKLQPIVDATDLTKVLGGLLRSASRLGPKDIQHIVQSIGSRRVVAIIDDLDRTDPRLLPPLFLHLRDVLESAGFVFLVPFDRAVVTRALSAYSEAWGRAGDLFLEKIFDFRISLPIPSASARVAFLGELMRLALPDYASFSIPEALGEALPPIARRIKAIARQVLLYRGDISRYARDELDYTTLIIGAALKTESEPFFEAVVAHFAGSSTEDEAIGMAPLNTANAPSESIESLFAEVFPPDECPPNSSGTLTRLRWLMEYLLGIRNRDNWKGVVRTLRLFAGLTTLTSAEYNWLILDDTTARISQLKAAWPAGVSIAEQQFARELVAKAIINLRLATNALRSSFSPDLLQNTFSNLARHLRFIFIAIEDPVFAKSSFTEDLRLAAFKAVLDAYVDCRLARLLETEPEVGTLLHTVASLLIHLSAGRYESYADILEGSLQGDASCSQSENDIGIHPLAAERKFLEDQVIDHIVDEFQRPGGLSRVLERPTSSILAKRFLDTQSPLWRIGNEWGPLRQLLHTEPLDSDVRLHSLHLNDMLSRGLVDGSVNITEPLRLTCSAEVTDCKTHPWSRLREDVELQAAIGLSVNQP